VLKELVATYKIHSRWDLDKLDLNLGDVYQWFIKYDILHVQRKKGSIWEEHLATWTQHVDLENPEELKLDGATIAQRIEGQDYEFV
jgi:hypothetical protein